MTNYIKYEVKVCTNGDKYWYLNGKYLTEEEFNERMVPTVEMTMAQINEALGKNVKVVK